MTIIVYHLKLEEPAIFTAIEGDPNSAVSYDFIPGSAIRGMFIGQYMRQHNVNIDAAHPDHRRLFFSPATRYLNAYPAFGDSRSLPVPATWKTPKYLTPEEKKAKQTNTGDIFKITDAYRKDESKTPPRKPKSESGFTVINMKTNEAQLYKTQRVINVHTKRARTSSAEQLVYRYEAIAPQQTFIGAIYCASKTDADKLYELLTVGQKLNMGGARSAGYGLMRVESLKIKPEWEEIKQDWSAGEIILTFLSDAIFQNSHGEYVTTSTAIQSQLKVQGITCEVESVALKRTLIGGFNRKWGLPTPQIPVIARGSVLRLKNIQRGEKTNESFEQLTRLGIGEQTLDGYGRVALNWQQKPRLIYRTHKPGEQALEKIILSDESKGIWSGISQRLTQRNIDERSVGVVFDKSYTIRGNITRAQLSRLRTVIADELRSEKPNRVVLSQFLELIKGKAAGKQFEDARIGNESLVKWLRQPFFPELGKELQERDRYVLQLVDAVLERAHKEKSGEN